MPSPFKPTAIVTECDLSPRRIASRRLLLAASVVCAAAAPSTAAAQSPSSLTTSIYTCTDANGRRLTSDRPIAECVHKEQLVLNRDGSLRAVLPPTLTAEERAVKEAQERAAAVARAAQSDAVRRDRNLMARYPDEATHNRAREAAADTVRLAMKASAQRLRDLDAERKPLTDEAEFYVGKPLPPKLRLALDANDAAMEAQRDATATQEAELVRINKLYDVELERLRRLWSGAQPGSLGPISEPAAASRPPPKKAARPATPSSR